MKIIDLAVDMQKMKIENSFNQPARAFLDKNTSDFIKFIAAFFVVMGHIDQQCPFWFRLFFNGSLWVGIFFFYSGFGLNTSLQLNPRYLHRFLLKKILRIYVPFYIAETVCTIIIGIQEGKFPDEFLWRCLGIHLTNNLGKFQV